MNATFKFKTVFSALTIAMVAILLPRAGFSTDYRTAATSANTSRSFENDRVVRLALSLGRATGAIPAKRAQEIYEAVNNDEAVPADLSNSWQKLLRIAQYLTLIENNSRFFSVGYEFEVMNPNVAAFDDFEKGIDAYEKLIAQSFGVQGSRTYSEKARIRDDKNRIWRIVTEWVRENDPDKGGWEVVSPPFRQAEDLHQLAAFRWRLGESAFGQSNKMTGLHQTYELVPIGAQADSKLMARIVANMYVLQAQFGPTLFELFDVRRFGGPENLFLRPVVYDHYEMLERLSNADPRTLELADIHKMLFVDYLDKEIVVHLKNEAKSWGEEYNPNDPEVRKILDAPLEERQRYRRAWKYRDGQVKYNLKSPHDTLFEVRIGDYVSSSPEKTLLQTVLYQYILNAAYEKAVKGEIFKLDMPRRADGETEVEYFKRLQLEPQLTKESLFRLIGIKDPNIANAMFGRKFDLVVPRMQAGDKPTYGFEIEMWSEKLVNVILPRKPKLRAKWREMSEAKRVKTMREMGFEFDGSFSDQKYRILTSEFTADTEKFPWLSPDLHLETSGNTEIKTNNRGLSDINEMRGLLRKTVRPLREAGQQFGGVHLHAFLPKALVDRVAQNKKAGHFVDVLERMSLFMTVKNYAEASYVDPYHALDSWSIDRYSPKDLEMVRQYLEGEVSLDWLRQKYHNIGTRPVNNGLDMEVRDIGDDIDYGFEQLARIQNAIVAEDFGDEKLVDDKPLFMEFSDHPDLKGVERFTLADAVGKKYALTAEQKSLLHKMQFEIYRPSMSDYMYWDDFSGIEETPDGKLDTKEARANYENNVAIPLLNYEEQSFVSERDLKRIAKAREAFVDRVYNLMKKVERDKKLDFIRENENFLHLAEWLKRSTHASRPNFKLAPKAKKAEAQREALEELTYDVRALVVRFVHETELDAVLEKSLPKPVLKSVEELLAGKNRCHELLTKR